MRNGWETWNEAANRRLRILLLKGTGDKDISFLLDRPLTVVQDQIAKLGIRRPTSELRIS
jgi:hypothetical protein